MISTEQKTKQNIFTKLMSMDDKVWARHANPWSVWTRVLTGLPVMLISTWSIKTCGWWSIAIIALAAFWIWINPRLFSPPKNTDNWASKVTFGERVWLNRYTQSIPKHHRQWALSLSIIAGIGFVIATIGAYHNNLFATIAGGLISWFGKMWFCDRMVWLYENMQDKNPEYQSWQRHD
jgi:hypothetical protein